MTATLKTTKRDRTGTRPARYLRLQGRIPVNLQGDGKEQLLLSIDSHEFMTARRHHEHVFALDIEGGSNETCMVRELQWDPLGDSIVHVEFRRVDLMRETEAEVGLEFIGHPKGGVLNHLLTHVTLAAVPSAIPDVIEVNVDDMEIGHPLHAGDLKLPEGVRLAMEPGTPIAVVAAFQEEEPETPAAEGEEGAAEGETKPVEGEAKSEEGEG